MIEIQLRHLCSLASCFLQAVKAAAGVLTLKGSLVSDTALLCRTLAKPCVTAVTDAHFASAAPGPAGTAPVAMAVGDAAEAAPAVPRGDLVFADGRTLRSGDRVTLDGSR